MTTYVITAPDGKKYRVTGEGTKEEALAQVQGKVQPPDKSFADTATAAVAGANELLPNILGMPMDTMTNLANLGIAGYGRLKGAFQEEGQKDLPELLGPQWGGSEYFKQKIRGLWQNIPVIGGDPFYVPNPEDPSQQNARMAGSILASGVLAPASSGAQVARNVASMAPAAVGAVAGKETFPDEPLAPMAGMMAGAATVPAFKAAANYNPPKKAFVKAVRLGYKVPPAQGKATATQQFMEGTAGPVPTKQTASIHNQKITNSLIKRDLGIQDDVPITQESLEAVRAQAGRAYEVAKNAGPIRVDNQFRAGLAGITKRGSALYKEMPGLVKKDVNKLVNMFNKKGFSAEALVEASKQLRADAKAGFRSQDPSVTAMARAQGKIADNIDRLIERQVKNPEIVANLKDARRLIAKTYQVENALKGDNVDAVALARELDKGKPMTGLTREVAEFGQNFKGAAQVNPPQSTNFRPMDVLTGIGGAVASGNVTWLAAAGIRPALRTLILSKPYQAMAARVPRETWQQVLSLPPESQVPAMMSIFNQMDQNSAQ